MRIDVNSIKDFGNFQIDIMDTTYISLDIETSGLNEFTDYIKLIQIRMLDNTYIIYPLNLEVKYVKYLLELINQSNKTVIGHNIEFDLRFLRHKYDILLTNVADTMLSEVLINNGLSTGKSLFSLKELVEKYFGVTLDKTVRDQFIGNTPVTEEMIKYAYEDVQYLEPMYKIQKEKLIEQKQDKILEIENKVIPIVVDMHLNGIKIDVDMWKAVSAESEEKLKTLRKELLYEIAQKADEYYNFKTAYDAVTLLGIKKPLGILKKDLMQVTDKTKIINFIKNTFNLNSNKQMLNILVYLYGVPIKNTNEKTINKFVDSVPIIKKLLDYRGYEKEVTSFNTGYLSKINPQTGRIHTFYKQLGARTGRFSSEEPNMQNVKGEDDEGRNKYRECFIADTGKYLISADYAQQELRILADITRDSKMLETFSKELDPHIMTATGLFHKEYDQVTKAERKRGKSLNFAINYGSTEYGLERNFDIPQEEGKDNIKNYFLFYSDYARYVDYVSTRIWEKGYSTTLLGRKRFFDRKIIYEPGLSKQFYKERVLRALRNLIIQGTGADMVKIALIKLFYENPFGDKLKILLQIHDEIVLECDEDIVDMAVEFVKKQMLSAEDSLLSVVKSKVDVKFSKHWEH